jgi:predicted chitinase
MKLLVLLMAISLINFSCGSNTAATHKANSAVPFNLITEKQFNELFPNRNAFYTYAAFMKAVNQLSKIQVKVSRRSTSIYQYIRTDKATGKTTVVRQDENWNEDWAKKKPDSVYTIDYGTFCTEKDVQTNKKELAAFLANIAHETRAGQNGKHDDGLIFIHENDSTNAYLSDNDAYPAVKGKKYYGRGPIQLSYNGNYGKAADFIFGDKKVLLNNPKLIETDPVIAFETAIWFWMTPDTRKPSAHDVMIGKWQPNATDKAKGRTPGFGMTINIINGDVECNKGDNMVSMKDRIDFYQYFLQKLGATDPNCACSCGKMQAFHY